MSINTDPNPFNIIPWDIFPTIFKNLTLEMDIVALVCKTWKESVDSETFREMIRPPRVMGIKQLINHNPNIISEGKEHPLPRKFYKEYAEKGGLCFFNPGRVKLKIADGKYKVVVLNTLEAIASLFPNPDLKTRFTDDSFGDALKAIREEEAPHWVWEEAQARGFRKSYKDQQKMAQYEDQALYPERYPAPAIFKNSSKEDSSTSCNSGKANSFELPFYGFMPLDRYGYGYIVPKKQKQIVVISNAEDHVLGKFMAEAILGEREVTWDENSTNPAIKGNCVRVSSTVKFGRNYYPSPMIDAQILIGVAVSGLHVHPRLYARDHAGPDVGFVCARKSFAT